MLRLEPDSGRVVIDNAEDPRDDRRSPPARVVLRGNDIHATILLSAKTRALRATYLAGVIRSLRTVRSGLLLNPATTEEFELLGGPWEASQSRRRARVSLRGFGQACCPDRVRWRGCCSELIDSSGYGDQNGNTFTSAFKERQRTRTSHRHLLAGGPHFPRKRKLKA